MATLFELLGGVRREDESANRDDWFQMQHELRRPEQTGAFTRMPPIVAMDAWYNSDEYQELMQRNLESEQEFTD